MRWNIGNTQTPTTVAELRTLLVSNRVADDANDFFTPRHPQEYTASEVGIKKGQLQKAVSRIQAARDAQETVVVFGDYDADGVSATAVLWKALRDVGCLVHPFIPQRDMHGYGLSLPALETLFEQLDPRLIITVDNGIVAHRPAQFLQEKGIDLIISDHHQPEGSSKAPVLPPAYAIVHTTQLCGTTVAWMLARAVLASENTSNNREWELDIAAIATVADQVPLKGINRSFVYHGLPALRTSKRVGLRALLHQAGVVQSEVSSQTIGFAIAPRINAMGRLGSSLDALRLLLTNNTSRAERLASILGQTNTRRQDLTLELFDDALHQANEQKDEHLIIVHSSHYHEGIIGLIAGRLMEQFYKPVIALSVGENTAKGSARSVAGVNIVELIRLVQTDLLEVGGHPMAAGFGLETAKLNKVIDQLQSLAKKTIAAERLEPAVYVDTLLPVSLISEKTAKMIDEFAPFGQGNAEPVFGFQNLQVIQSQTMGKEQQHLKVVAKERDGVQPFYFVAWRQGQLASQLTPGSSVAIAGRIESNIWRNKVSVQVRVADIVIEASTTPLS